MSFGRPNGGKWYVFPEGKTVKSSYMAPVRFAEVKSAAVRSALDRFAPDRFANARSAPVRIAESRFAFDMFVLTREAPSRLAPADRNFKPRFPYRR